MDFTIVSQTFRPEGTDDTVTLYYAMPKKSAGLRGAQGLAGEAYGFDPDALASGPVGAYAAQMKALIAGSDSWEVTANMGLLTTPAPTLAEIEAKRRIMTFFARLAIKRGHEQSCSARGLLWRPDWRKAAGPGLD